MVPSAREFEPCQLGLPSSADDRAPDRPGHPSFPSVQRRHATASRSAVERGPSVGRNPVGLDEHPAVMNSLDAVPVD